ncbi:hypothetical protein BCR33DRAFT_860719 [Rhizoclosmatium globosum]|uniref:Uncharacterized protein n=1 Tax=Rhizoclosmatium globosum TaxID=329046 RepID=A0A1Y2AM35_9FUNG|nr:hypothetical protein BCR33DRAFT_860719 [Rhizoclosmatium globosum]|eukprot:ORY23643.1 hypothetical protein BCR33DRAFT_860719 [Rhizoclosmatium globosum]
MSEPPIRGTKRQIPSTPNKSSATPATKKAATEQTKINSMPTPSPPQIPRSASIRTFETMKWDHRLESTVIATLPEHCQERCFLLRNHLGSTSTGLNIYKLRSSSFDQFGIFNKSIGTERANKVLFRSQFEVHHYNGFFCPSEMDSSRTTLRVLPVSFITESEERKDLAKWVHLIAPLANSNFIPTRLGTDALQLSSFNNVPIYNATDAPIEDGSYPNLDLRSVTRKLKEGDCIDVTFHIRNYYLREGRAKNGTPGATQLYPNFTFSPVTIHLFATRDPEEVIPDMPLSVPAASTELSETRARQFTEDESNLLDSFE